MKSRKPDIFRGVSDPSAYCPKCKQIMYVGDDICPHCNYQLTIGDQEAQKKFWSIENRKWIKLGLIFFVLYFGVVIAYNMVSK